MIGYLIIIGLDIALIYVVFNLWRATIMLNRYSERPSLDRIRAERAAEWEIKHNSQLSACSPWPKCQGEHAMTPINADPFGSAGWKCRDCGHFALENLSQKAKP